jgi:hypothetical protein
VIKHLFFGILLAASISAQAGGREQCKIMGLQTYMFEISSDHLQAHLIFCQKPQQNFDKPGDIVVLSKPFDKHDTQSFVYYVYDITEKGKGFKLFIYRPENQVDKRVHILVESADGRLAQADDKSKQAENAHITYLGSIPANAPRVPWSEVPLIRHP